MTDSAVFAHHEFGSVRLGHHARTKRAVQLAEAMAENPSASLPTLFADAAQAKLAYALLRHRDVRAIDLLENHAEATVARCASHAVVLVVQDTSEADFTSHKKTQGLGPIGNSPFARGFLFHSALAVSADERHTVLGVVHQHAWVRPVGTSKRSKKIPSAQRKKDVGRESQKWLTAATEAHARFADSAPRLIHIGDRESDIFELLEMCDQLGDSFVLRATQNRCLSSLEEERSNVGIEQVEPAATKLFAAAHQAPVLATKTVTVRASKEHVAHQAKVEVRAATVRLEPPKNRIPRGHALTPHVVLVVEPEPPDASEPLCWYLLTREPIETTEQVLFVVCCYEARWRIEEFHMGIKTGCSLEKRQLETFHALRNFLSFASVCAWQLLLLRDAARQPAPPPASEVLSPQQLDVLHGLRPKLRRECTAYEALRAIAQLGGFLARKSDGEPGWRTLWLGFRTLQVAVRGYQLAKSGREPLSGDESFG